MDPVEFEALVVEALESLPEEIARYLNNVDVVVEQAPTSAQMRRVGLRPSHTLFGLYEGIPLTRRTTNYGLVLPDRITIFQQPIEQACRTEPQIRAQVRRTVIHELAHHFGISDDRLRQLGAY
ncbi:MAG TPA: metallopeptidase family protein [Ardenticatenaceae bacterium]|nr:metallopeptidase family protein [Ardenticatenaceae bacterium]